MKNEIVVQIMGNPPCDAHHGWIYLDISDPYKIFTEEELEYFTCEDSGDDDLTPHKDFLKGYSKSGGIYEYEERLIGIKFKITLDSKRIQGVKKRAKLGAGYV